VDDAFGELYMDLRILSEYLDLRAVGRNWVKVGQTWPRIVAAMLLACGASTS